MRTQTTDLLLVEDLEDGGAQSWAKQPVKGRRRRSTYVMK